MSNSEVRKLISPVEAPLFNPQSGNRQVPVTLKEKIRANHFPMYQKFGWNHDDRCVCKKNGWVAPKDEIKLSDF